MNARFLGWSEGDFRAELARRYKVVQELDSEIERLQDAHTRAVAAVGEIADARRVAKGLLPVDQELRRARQEREQQVDHGVRLPSWWKGKTPK